MRPVIAHGSGGGFDELFIFAGFALVVVSVAQLLDKQRRGKRWLVALGIPVGLVLTVTSIMSLARGPRMASVRIASSASVAITAPAAGASVARPLLIVAFDLTGATLTEDESTNLRPDRGHLHVVVDGEVLPGSFALRGQVDIDRFSVGRHLLEVEFVATDHGPFAPPVKAVVPFVLSEKT